MLDNIHYLSFIHPGNSILSCLAKEQKLGLTNQKGLKPILCIQGQEKIILIFKAFELNRMKIGTESPPTNVSIHTSSEIFLLSPVENHSVEA